MRSINDMILEEVAAYVCDALARAGVTVTLTGGGAASIWAEGAFESDDLDLVEDGLGQPAVVRRVVTGLGFRLSSDRRHYEHESAPVFLEFPAGPLMAGSQPIHERALRPLETGLLRLLTPTDCVKDRLAAYFHWDDRQALEQAVAVVQKNEIDMADLRRWVRDEGASQKFAAIERRLVQ